MEAEDPFLTQHLAMLVRRRVRGAEYNLRAAREKLLLVGKVLVGVVDPGNGVWKDWWLVNTVVTPFDADEPYQDDGHH